MKIIMATGGFDPIHEGHIAYLNEAKSMGDRLIVGVNSDEWLVRKKGYNFQSVQTRGIVMSNLKCVDGVMYMDDWDGTAIQFIRECIRMYGDSCDYYFVNGGDRTVKNVPERIPEFDGLVHFVYGVGGEDKKNSSSDMVNRLREDILPEQLLR